MGTAKPFRTLFLTDLAEQELLSRDKLLALTIDAYQTEEYPSGSRDFYHSIFDAMESCFFDSNEAKTLFQGLANSHTNKVYRVGSVMEAGSNGVSWTLDPKALRPLWARPHERRNGDLYCPGGPLGCGGGAD